MAGRRWGSASQRVFDTLHPHLRILVTRLRDEVVDISLLYGFRCRELQNTMYENGVSEKRYPDSKHNKYPSLAVDLQPYPMSQRKEVAWASLGYVAGHAMRIAEEEGFEIRWGFDWDRDGDLTDTRFYDGYHFELVVRKT